MVYTAGFEIAPAPRPSLCGVSISLHYQHSAGTLGCLVEDSDATRFLLSNSHVIADLGRAPMRSDIVQPGILDGGVPATDVVARLSAHMPINFAPRAPNRVDAAIAELTDRGHLDPRITIIGRVGNPPVAAALGQTVQKHGRTTSHTAGTVVDISYTGKARYGAQGTAWFHNQIVIEDPGGIFSQPGDSGSLIVDRSNRPVALLFAGDPSGRTIANPIGDILAAFSVSIV